MDISELRRFTATMYELRPLIANFSCKLSTVSDFNAQKQILCVVSQENDIILRYTNENWKLETLKLISWFRKTNRVIHDCCFDPNGEWLLVLCFDNTLHIIPALAIVDKTFADFTNGAQQKSYSTTQVTSYIIPFVGPHECPNSKKCPNQNNGDDKKCELDTSAEKGAQELSDNLGKLQLVKENNTDDEEQALLIDLPPEVSSFSHDLPANMLAVDHLPTAANEVTDKTGNSQVMTTTSFMASSTCPYPLSVIWWQTIDGVNRAIIGYSDGSICFVGLSPNCPFVASTAIESGSVVKLLICKDNTFESVMLMITSSLKIQYKLLLEQKAIKYIYPGDISPTNNQARESDWQIVMPLKQSGNPNNSISSDPASDSSQCLDDEVFDKHDDSSSVSTTASQGPQTAKSIELQRPPPPTFSEAQAKQALNSSSSPPSNTTIHHMNFPSTNQMPPPPPYSVAINRHIDNAPVTTVAGNIQATSTMSSGVRFQQQQLDSSRGGILPAARARLSSLKSLGSKKLTAIKMRLYDNRQKMEEYIPGNNLSSFAIMDSPSLTPEVLGNSNGSFFTLQNLRSTYLISALHSQSNTLTVHTIDASLRPLFFYKIPKNCFDILISSNILYAIQYVDIKSQDDDPNQLEELDDETRNLKNKECNTEKENRDTDTEKQDSYAEAKSIDEDHITLEKKNETVTASEQRGSDSVETSATTSGASSSPNSYSPSGNMINAVGVISSAMASCTNHDMKNKPESMLALFRFENETVLNLYQMATYRSTITEPISKEEKAKAFAYKDIRSPIDYVEFYTTSTEQDEEFSLRQMEIMQNEFPKINYDPCYVITNKNVFYIQLKQEPFAIFLEAALASDWKQCREFCNTFDISYETCIEFAGDYLLRRNKITQALLTYNSARVKPIRTALKLAMFGHTCALMHLCAMALKITYILKSQYFCNFIIKTILPDITYRHSEDVREILPKTAADRSKEGNINEGASCSDYIYGVDEVISNLQMPPSSQFHLANLLLITLAEKAVKDKNYIPLWNFLAINSKYHTNMTSIVLCQSGLYSSALILAKVRGVWIDTFVALTSVVAQEFGWYTELNVCLYNLSDLAFVETITYMPHVAVDYFNFIQQKRDQIRLIVLKRLEQQLNPFSAALRPIVSHNSSVNTEYNANDNNPCTFDFCKNLIETYLAVLIHMESQRSKRECISNALSTFRITYEDNQFAIESTRFKPVSAGCAHCACVIDGVAYFWGSNGVPCNYNVNKSSDPPEPPHAVKRLELLSQLNLEVHTVKCGRQHTLILTNNGLYAFGNNYQSQLGIGNHTQAALQPMLVKAFDGKDITILEAGQYHNAALAGGLLYTWGWGVYGQLGHGNSENVATPKLVIFFKYKKVIQVSLGHAHSLVLCQSAYSNTTDLYVFGSNHFGQLGIGSGASVNDCGNDELYANQVKSAVPLKLDVCISRLRLIHTKFFTNLAVDETGKMYTWGSSPQALRLANQIKRRANAKQKIEEQQRREISKQFEATISQQIPMSADDDKSLTTSVNVTVDNIIEKDAEIETESGDEHVNVSKNSPSAKIPIIELEKKKEVRNTNSENYRNNEELIRTEILATSSNDSKVTVEDIDNDSDCEADVDIKTKSDANEISSPLEIELLDEENVPSITPIISEQNTPITVELPKGNEMKNINKKIGSGDLKAPSVETDPCEHMTPHLVDTSEVAGQILQISSGLFHFALISSTCTMYTWGKNLEHQLGTEDKERRAVNKPMPLDNIESPMYVDCGADFTLVMTTDYVVKAFGGNSNGQCGRDLGPSIDKMKQRVVCLPTTKRFMRFESQCVEIPVEINLPRPSIRLYTVRYLKSIPCFQPHFVQEADMSFQYVLNCMEHRSSSRRYNITSENSATGQESDDMISSLENLSNNEIVGNFNVSIGAFGADSCTGSNDNSSYEMTPEEQSYARLATDAQYHGSPQKNNVDPSGVQQETSLTSASDSTDEVSFEEDLQQLRHFVHYCLYIFHGLYNPDRVCDFSKERLEYRIRVQMLNFKFIDAFVLCLEDCGSSHKALKIFEYYSKDTSFVPMHRQDLKYLIYYLMRHFLARKLDMLECERFFLADLDFYLIELAYVLYFNNNNTVLEQNLNQKFKNILAQDESPQNEQHKLEDSVIHVIFDCLSVKFKAIVCQKLLKHCSSQ